MQSRQKTKHPRKKNFVFILTTGYSEHKSSLILMSVHYFNVFIFLTICIMVNYCVAVGCKNRAQKGSGISFFLFPHKDPQSLNQWVHAIRRKDWKPSAHSCICSDHFEETCFVVRLGPTIFSNIEGHFFDHTLIEESNHLTTVMRVITKKYLSTRLKTYAKKYTEVVAHGNQPSSPHELTKTVLFRNQIKYNL